MRRFSPQYWTTVALGVVALIGGYWLTVSHATVRPAADHPATMPATPFIVHLALDPTPKGLLGPDKMNAENVTMLPDWAAVQVAAQKRPLDALIIDGKALDAASKIDASWLHARFDEGIVMVGIGVDDDRFAQFFGVDTFRVPGEANVPLGPTGYRMAYRVVLGSPEDRAKIANTNWFQRQLRGEDDSANADKIIQPMLRSSGIDRGDLSTELDIHLFFERLHSDIASVYQDRDDYHNKMQKTGGQ